MQCNVFLLKIATTIMTEGHIRQLSSLHSLKAQFFTPRLDPDLGKTAKNWKVSLTHRILGCKGI